MLALETIGILHRAKCLQNSQTEQTGAVYGVSPISFSQIENFST